MLGDIRELLRQGEEVNQQDSQGATLVRLHDDASEADLKTAEHVYLGGGLFVFSPYAALNSQN